LFVLIRAVVYSTLFIGFLLVVLPAAVLDRAGISPPREVGLAQLIGLAVGTLGAALAVSCILTFVFVGNGTPAPFDAPRRLVVRGPYRWTRNPMYTGATLVLAGAAAYYESLSLLTYAAGFLLAMHLFAVLYEEPVLRARFGAEYESYHANVGRWLPSFNVRR
jgi:protein-S-isoprenylcysteine O-methyltransferase Ste14